MRRDRASAHAGEGAPVEPRPPLVALTSALLVGALLLAPTSAWFAQASTLGPMVTAWQLIGNAGTNPSTNFLGTSDNQALVLRTNNVKALRVLAGSGSTGGNVGIGTAAPDARLSVAGTIHALSGGFRFPDGTTQATAGVTAVSASGPLASSGGTTPSAAASARHAAGSRWRS